MQHHILPCNVVSCGITSHCMTSQQCGTTPCHINMQHVSNNTVSHQKPSHHTMLYCIMPFHITNVFHISTLSATVCHITSHCTILHHAMSYHTTFQTGVLLYTTSHLITQYNTMDTPPQITSHHKVYTVL